MAVNKKPTETLLGGLLNSNPEGYYPPAAAKGVTLGSLFSAKEVSGLYFNRKTIHLDGYTFINCRFDNCTLQIATTDFELRDCVIDSSTIIEYSNNAVKVIKLFLSRYPWAYSQFPNFSPQRNSDGAITIR